jgi:CubicO group peptidase (beta-lactamase class C family)
MARGYNAGNRCRLVHRRGPAALGRCNRQRGIAARRAAQGDAHPHALTGHAASPAGWSVTGYGYGWQTGTIDGRRALFHTGANSGYLAVNAWLPDKQIAFAVLSNDQATNILQVTADLLKLAL